MPDSCTRVKAVVRAWAGVPDNVPISTARVLFHLWIQFGSSLAYCNDGVTDLINRLDEEFTELNLGFKTGDFCPPESATLRSVGDVCTAVVQSEPR